MVNVVEISEFRKKEYWLDYYEKLVEEKKRLEHPFRLFEILCLHNI